MFIPSLLTAVLLVGASLSNAERYAASKEALEYGDGPIQLGGIEYASREAFYATGARSRTVQPTDDELTEYERLMSTLPDEDEHEMSLQAIRTVDVYFHVITSTTGVAALADSTINSQVQVMNDAFRKTKFQFRLAGIDRTVSDAWYSCGMSGGSCQTDMKNALRAGPYAALNIYTTRQTDNTLGWTTYPANLGSNYKFDGAVVDFRTFPGGSFYPYNLGHTVTHEVGHWFGVGHTFQGGCAIPYSGGDGVKDTPAQASPEFGCPPESTDSCPGTVEGLIGNDPVHNFMNYVDDYCMTEFTKLQGKRMRKMYTLYRENK
jgi:hypothetical protein